MKYKTMAVAVLIIGLGIAGCTKKQSATTDEDAIQNLINGDDSPYFNYTATVNDSGTRNDTVPGSSKGTKGFIVAWGRQLTHVSSDINISINNDTANVIIARNLDGVLHIIWYDTAGAPLQDSIKDFTDQSHRYAMFVREGDPDEPIRKGWRLRGLSNVEIETQNLPDSIVKVNITKVEVTEYGQNDSIATGQYVYTDPSVLWNRDSIPTFTPGEKVRVRLYFDVDTPPSLGWLHYNTAMHRIRRDRMFYNSNEGCLEGVWYTPQDIGIYHAAVDIIEKPTFFDSKYPYVSNAWTIVYRVATSQ